MKDQLENLQRASTELARGFENAAKLEDKTELAEALGNASAALIEMRRATDALFQRVRPTCECRRFGFGSTRCDKCQHDLGCPVHNNGACRQ